MLSVAEETALHCSLTVLSQQTKKDIKFWGKVLGYSGDYLLCQGTGDDVLSARRSYFSTDGGLTWTILDQVAPDQREFCEQIRGLFMGDPSYEYRIQKIRPPEEDVQVAPAAEVPNPEDSAANPEATEEPEEPEDPEDGAADPEAGEGQPEGTAPAEGDDAPAEEKKSIKKKVQIQIVAIKESTRLAYFVEEHDYNCAVVPRGLYVCTQDGRVVKNKTYEGIDPAAAGKLSSYYHLRKRDPNNSSALGNESCNLAVDFLDSIQEDIPRGVWGLKYDPLLDVVVGQNLYFLGSTFFMKPNTATSGQFYIGDGEQNLDLCFML
jgi:hypothetical protein